MAKASLIKKEKDKEWKPCLTLTLSEKESRILHALTGRLTGGELDSVWDALTSVGVVSYTGPGYTLAVLEKTPDSVNNMRIKSEVVSWAEGD